MLFTTVMKSNRDFSRAYKKGRFCASDEVCAYYLINRTPYNKLGITTSKKLGNAVERNRARRIIRAAYRLCESKLPLGYDIVIVARQGIKDKKSTDIEKFLESRLIFDMKKRENEKGVRK